MRNISPCKFPHLLDYYSNGGEIVIHDYGRVIEEARDGDSMYRDSDFDNDYCDEADDDMEDEDESVFLLQ